MYERPTRKPRYHLETSNDRYKLVEQLYAAQLLPDIISLPLSLLTQKYWGGNASSMGETVIELEAFRYTDRRA